MKTMDQIIQSLPDFDRKSRRVEHVSVRHAFCYLAYDEGYMIYEIARYIGKDHSTVTHSVKKAKDLIFTKDKRMLNLINNKN